MVDCLCDTLFCWILVVGLLIFAVVGCDCGLLCLLTGVGWLIRLIVFVLMMILLFGVCLGLLIFCFGDSFWCILL